MKMVEKLQKRIQEGKKNNKGFSLVELIIVIAIMAILIGIVGMNVIPQIENARQSKDKQVLSAYLTESVQALTQNAALCSLQNYKITIKVPAEKDGNATITCSGIGGTDSNGEKAIRDAFVTLAGFTVSDGDALKGKPQFESNAGKGIRQITITLSLETGKDAAILVVDGDDSTDAAKALTSGNEFTSK